MITEKIWDFWAKRYERLWVQKYSLGPTRKLAINKIESFIDKKSSYSILDMGCGTGQFIEEMKQRFPDTDITYTGVDISPQMIKYAKKRVPNEKFIVSSIDDFNIIPESYDFIVCTHSFPYYLEKEKSLIKFQALLKPGGYLILAQASQNNYYDNIMMFFVKFTTSKAKYPSVEEIKSLVGSKLKLVETTLIREKFFMPSIYFFLCKKEENVKKS